MLDCSFNVYEKEVDDIVRSLLARSDSNDEEEFVKKNEKVKRKIKEVMKLSRIPNMQESQKLENLDIEFSGKTRKVAGEYISPEAVLNANSHSSPVNKRILFEHVNIEERYDNAAEDIVKWRNVVEGELEVINGILKMRNQIDVKDGILNVWLLKLDNIYMMSELIIDIMNKKVDEIGKEQTIYKTEIEEIRKKNRTKDVTEELEILKNCLKDVEAR